MGLDPKPDIGHADAEFHPDWIGHEWDDLRLVESHVNNNHRFLSAAKSLFEKYCLYLVTQGRPDNSSRWPGFKKTLTEMMGPTYSGNICNYERVEKRLAGYKKYLPTLPEFEEWEWFDAAIETKVVGLKDKKIPQIMTIFKDKTFWRKDIKKEKTHWYKFQEAVKDHEQFGIELISPVFQKMGVNFSKNSFMAPVG